jgi:hypothetical protein
MINAIDAASVDNVRFVANNENVGIVKPTGAFEFYC